MTDAKAFWNNLAEKYARTPIEDMDAYEYTLERTRSYIHATDTVLEVGGGTGTTALKLAGAAGHYTATDLAAKMTAIGVRKAEEAGISNVSFQAVDVMDGKSVPGPYDMAIAFNLLHLLKDLDGGIMAIRDRLKPGGLFVSKTFCLPEQWSAKLLAMRAALPVMQLFGRAPFVNFMTIGDLEARIVGAGFRIIETGNYPASPPRRFIVAEKV